MGSINVGLIGAGTVGTGVYKVIRNNLKLIKKRRPFDLKLVRIADIEPSRKRAVKIPRRLFTKDAYELINDPGIDIIIELVGGTKIAKNFVIDSLKAGKHVVTANKALLAHHGKEIFSLAAKKGLAVGFEASVGGGIPIIKSTMEGYAANNILSIHGIMNGTSNYILYKMTEEGTAFKTVLKQAQDEGYAESDPTFDIDGIDAAHKLSILIMLCWGKFFKFNQYNVEGIRKVTPLDITFADELGYKIKLLAIAKQLKNGIEAGVYPALVRKGTQLADVKEAFNAIYMVGDAVGPTMLYGMGAGMLPTASAVVSDLIEISNNHYNSNNQLVPRLYAENENIKLIDIKETVNKYYLRFEVMDKPGILGSITSVLGKFNISIESMIQKRKEGKTVPIVLMTHEAYEKDLLNALKTIESKRNITRGKTLYIRIEEV
ncbi:MAG: homoserine dehydrogenase [Thermodesulfobacteriota bacterium]